MSNIDTSLGSEHLPQSGVHLVIPAHNEESTIGHVVRACVGAFPSDYSDVTVVADHCKDRTGDVAEQFGVEVLYRESDVPSKADSMALAARHSSREFLFFVDADCVGLMPEHLREIARPVLEGRTTMSVGTFDYGDVANAFVRRVPWSSGQRVMPRSIFPDDDLRLEGYNVELLINEAIGRAGGATSADVMCGVSQMTKRDKFGLRAGVLATWDMWRSISKAAPDIDLEAYRAYSTKIEDREGRPYSRTVGMIGFACLLGASRLLSHNAI